MLYEPLKCTSVNAFATNLYLLLLIKFLNTIKKIYSVICFNIPYYELLLLLYVIIIHDFRKYFPEVAVVE
jgi:hypothetical protein